MKTVLNVLFYFSLLFSRSAYSEVVTDGTVGTPGTLGSPQHLSGQMVIPQNFGTTVGNNLFHSFKTFNINTGESAAFTGAESIKNVISRVTGGQVSNINGLLQSKVGQANFYFINPAGVIFGAGAEVNVPAAFHVSTADKLNFTDGKAFYADPTNPQSSLSIAPVASFGFLGTSPNNNGLIQVNNPKPINFKTGQSVDLVAGNITINNNATLSAPAGEIRLVAIKGNNKVSLERDDNGFLPLPTQKPNLDNGATISLNSGNLDTVGNGGGRIALWGGKTEFSNSTAFADNNGNKDAAVGKNLEIQAHSLNVKDHSYLSFDALAGKGDAGNVTVNVTGALNITNDSIIKSSTFAEGNAGNVSVRADNLNINRESDAQNWTTGIFSEAGSGSTGNSGSVNVNAKTIRILNGGVIKSSTLAPGNAGDVVVTAADGLITINNGGFPIFGGIYSLNADRGVGSGHSGNVTVNTGTLDILNGGKVLSSTFGQGNAGSVTVTADNLKIDNQANSNGETGIFSNAELNSSGNAGTVTVNANALNVLNGGLISSSTYAFGDANTVRVSAQILNIDSQNNASSLTGIISNADEGSSGNAGSIVVNAKQITNIVNGGEISSSTFSQGNAGNVSVTANSLNIDSQGFSEWGTGVFSQANPNSSGKVGNVSVNANSKITLSNNGRISIANYGTANEASAVSPGTLTITAPTIDMQDSNITTESTGNVDAGNINISFSDGLRSNASFITTEANTGNGGTITINGGQLIYLQDSGFQTSVSGANSNGGNINVSADALVMDTGLIQANAVGGSGGDIRLNLQTLIPSQNYLMLGGRKIEWQPDKSGLNIIQAASETGVSGAINVTAPQFDISGGISGLDTRTVVLPMVIHDPCRSAAVLSSSLARGGKGGVPLSERKAGFIPAAIESSDFKAGSNSGIQSTEPSATDKAKLKENYPCAPISSE